MLIAHVSDFHVVGRGLRLKNRVDTRAALERLAKRLQGLAPRPDLLLVSGDLGEDATADEYGHVRDLLRPLALPTLAVPGNHDLRAPLIEALPDIFVATRDGFLCRAIEAGEHAIIGLDTLVEGAAHGALCPTRLAWLDAALADTKGRRRVIVMHHPPIAIGMASMDAIGLNEGKAGLAELIRQHGDVELILCGHAHRTSHGTFAGVPVRVAPSSSHQFAFDTTPGAPFRFTNEAAQFMLHMLGSGDGAVTHTLYVEDFG